MPELPCWNAENQRYSISATCVLAFNAVANRSE